MKTLYSIKNFQTLCQQNNIKYRIFFWMKELGKRRKQIIDKNIELTFWYNSIDWSMFWFHNQEEGLCEWGIDHGFTGALNEDHINTPPQGWAVIEGKKTMVGHPSTECHQAFAEQVVKKWLN